uniref:Amino acid adenylation domain protein n=1 Tax=Streptomyces sp. NRRL 30471 TaxID=996287 RepID=F2WUC5_9ACTN|nr:amino acid adenylation domain protein [Streptomyces sp. NRRL 30471]
MTGAPASLTARYLERFRSRWSGASGESVQVLPATSAQRRFAVLEVMAGRRLAVPLFFSLPCGLVDEDRLRRALERVADRHPALRCTVRIRNGLVVQEWSAERSPDVASVRIGSSDDAGRAAAQAIEVLEDHTAAGPLHAVLLRGPERDLIGFVFDHAVVDESSLRLFTTDLFLVLEHLDAPQRLGERPGAPWADFRDAVWAHLEREAAAAGGTRTDYWVRKLTPVAARALTTPSVGTGGTSVDVVEPPPLPLPEAGARPVLFPLALASLHRVLRSAGASPPTSIGYAWGGRQDSTDRVIGCFMNTVLSTDGPGPWNAPEQGLAAFVDDWWQDLEHADVPFDEVVTAVDRVARSSWPGTADALMVFEDLRNRAPLRLSGQAVEEWLSPVLSPKAELSTALRLDGDGLHLRLLTAPGHSWSAQAAEFAETWRGQLADLLDAYAHHKNPGG